MVTQQDRPQELYRIIFFSTPQRQIHDYFIRKNSIRISRLRFGPNIWPISKNNRLGILLKVPNHSLHHGMELRAISGGGEGREFEKLKIEVKTNRA